MDANRVFFWLKKYAYYFVPPKLIHHPQYAHIEKNAPHHTWTSTQIISAKVLRRPLRQDIRSHWPVLQLPVGRVHARCLYTIHPHIILGQATRLTSLFLLVIRTPNKELVYMCTKECVTSTTKTTNDTRGTRPAGRTFTGETYEHKIDGARGKAKRGDKWENNKVPWEYTHIGFLGCKLLVGRD